MFEFDFSLLLRGQYHEMLVAGLLLSLKLAAVTLVFAVPLAMLVAL
ncbi:amino acid ABC transporter permease, partial [Pseudomonas aeruginosa]